MCFYVSKMCQTGASISSKVGGKVTHADSNAVLESVFTLRLCGFIKHKPAIGYFLTCFFFTGTLTVSAWINKTTVGDVSV